MLSHICIHNSLADINNNSQDDFLGIIKNINVSILNEEDRYFKLNNIFIQTLETNIKFSPCQKISALVYFTIQNFKLHKKDIKIFIDLLNIKIENIKSDNKNTIEIKQEALNNIISVVKLLFSKFLDETNSSIKEAINYAILDFKNISEKINLDITKYINNIIECRFNNLINSDKNSYIEKFIPPKINFKYKDSIKKAYYVTDIENGKKL